MGDYDLYADGYINRCFRLYNLSYYDYDADEPAPNVAYNTLNINALPYNFLENQYFELECYLNLDNQAAPLLIDIGPATLAFYKNFIWMYYTSLSHYTISPPLSSWNKIKIKYDNGTWDIYLNDVLLVPRGGDKYLLISDPVNSIKFYSFLVETSFPDPVFYYNLVDEIKINGDSLTYAIIYNGNSATSGTAPSEQIKTHGIELTLATNYGALARTGYIFTGWNTAADGTGSNYTEGASYTIDAAATLYAKWTAYSPGHLPIIIEHDGTIVSGSLRFRDDSIGSTSWEWKIGTIVFSHDKNPIVNDSIADYLDQIITIGETDYLPVTLTINVGQLLKSESYYEIEIIYQTSGLDFGWQSQADPTYQDNPYFSDDKQPIQFIDKTSGVPVSRLWDFGYIPTVPSGIEILNGSVAIVPDNLTKRVVSNDNGNTWNELETGFPFATPFDGYNSLLIKQYGSISIALNSNKILTSTDTIVWTIRLTIPATYGDVRLRYLTYGNGVYVASGEIQNQNYRIIATSSDGLSWEYSIISGTVLRYITWWNGYFYASTGNLLVQRSLDLITWNTVYTNLTYGVQVITTSTNNNYIIFAMHTYPGIDVTDLIYSNNGTTWVKRILSDYSICITILFVNSIYYLFYFEGVVKISPDLVSWVTHISNLSSISYAAYGNSIFVCLSLSGTTIQTSTDALNWTLRYTSYNLHKVKFLNGYFYAVGTDVSYPTLGAILKSSDGIIWTNTISFSEDFFDIAFGNNLYVAIGQYVVATSIDGNIWIKNARTGLVGWWKGEDDTVDSVNGNNGIWVNPTRELYDTGYIGKCFKLVYDAVNENGVYPIIKILNNSVINFSGTDKFTIEIWNKGVDEQGYGNNEGSFSIVKGSQFTLGEGFSISWSSDYFGSTFGIGIQLPGLESQYYSYGAGVILNNWKLFTIAYDNGRWEFYIDNILQIPTGGYQELVIQANSYDYFIWCGAYLNGALLDELKIYDDSVPLSEFLMFDGTKFVASHNQPGDYYPHKIISSTDGIIWSDHNAADITAVDSGLSSQISFYNGMYYVGGQGGHFWKSTNLDNWTSSTQDFNNRLTNFIYNNSIFLICVTHNNVFYANYHTTLYKTIDADTFIVVPTNISDNEINNIMFDGSKFFATDETHLVSFDDPGGSVTYIENGLCHYYWSLDLIVYNRISRISKTNSKYYMIGSLNQYLYGEGFILVSDDGITWVRKYVQPKTSTEESPVITLPCDDYIPTPYNVTLTRDSLSITKTLTILQIRGYIAWDSEAGEHEYEDPFDILYQPILFYVSEIYNVVTYDWDFGDGSPHSYSATPTHSYPSPFAEPGSSKQYTITCILGDGHGNFLNRSQNLTIKVTVPFVDFTWVVDGTDYKQINFTDTSLYSPTAWDWDWGDGTAHGTTQNPSHVYANYDTSYDVILTAITIAGTDSKTKTVTTLPEPGGRPVAEFKWKEGGQSYFDYTNYLYKYWAGDRSLWFKDYSTNIPTSWKWEIWNYNTLVYDTVNTTSLFNLPYGTWYGVYYWSYWSGKPFKVKLTVTNGSGSDTKQYIFYYDYMTSD